MEIKEIPPNFGIIELAKNYYQIGGISMLKDKDMQLSIYSVLYSKIPENHTLKVLRDEVDFSFINEKLEKTYCKRYGRPAKEPELMLKLLVLQYLYNLSDVRVDRRSFFESCLYVLFRYQSRR